MKRDYPLIENGEIIVRTGYQPLFKGRVLIEEQENVEQSKVDYIEDGLVMSKNWNPKKFVVRREWVPKNAEVDAKVSDVEKGNKYKAGQPAIIDGEPFIWTVLDSESIRRVCSKAAPNKKRVDDYIKDGMNNGDVESFNW